MSSHPAEPNDLEVLSIDDDLGDAVNEGMGAGEKKAPPPMGTATVAAAGASTLVSASDSLDTLDPNLADTEFLARLFHQVKGVDWRAPMPPPPRHLLGPEKKMYNLREQVRRLERHLSRMAGIWADKEAAIREVDAIVAQKEQERYRAVMRLEGAEKQAQQAAAKFRDDIMALQALVQTLSGHRSDLQDQLQREEQRRRREVSALQDSLQRSNDERRQLTQTLQARTEEAKQRLTQVQQEAARAQMGEKGFRVQFIE